MVTGIAGFISFMVETLHLRAVTSCDTDYRRENSEDDGQ
jgi:hypothetical protein